MMTLEKVTVSPAVAYEKKLNGVLMVDVREYPEWCGCHVDGARLVPLGDLSQQLGDLKSTSEVLLLCRSGRRAAQAAQILAQNGINPQVVEGGLEAWKSAGLPTTKAAKGPISLERQVRTIAGTLVLLGLLVPVLRPISYLVGAGLVFAGLTDWCGLAVLLAKLPWNRAVGNVTSCSR